MSALQMCQHNSMVQILNKAFGSGSGKGDDNSSPVNVRDEYNDISAGATSAEAAVAHINALMRGG